jgi:hypothetical protein
MDEHQMQFADQDDEFAPRGLPGFIEGMAVFAIDPVSRISVTHNFFAAADGSDQCHQTLSVNLPDGRVAALSEPRPLEVVPTTAWSDFRYEQIEPFRRWTVSFDGSAAFVRQDEALRRVIDDPERHPLAFELELSSVTPPWRPPTTPLAAPLPEPIGDSNVFGFFVQNVEVQGHVRCEGRSLDLTGTGWRLHVRAAPWELDVIGHHFVHVVFPSGRAFGLQVVQTSAGEYSLPAYVFEDGKLHDAVVREITDWTRLRGHGEHPTIVLERADGVVAEVSGETLNNAAIANGRGGYGVDFSDPDAVVMLFADTRWTWDGEDAYGVWERTKRVGLLDRGD